uniref:Uncharacterized protein n=1 Tax=Rhizophagus irregularis (strain DAOM 181602 / DAOM 197198 / MUCL 43194) TaxID=747089 RepID=U9T9J4_RHIID
MVFEGKENNIASGIVFFKDHKVQIDEVEFLELLKNIINENGLLRHFSKSCSRKVMEM